MRLPLQISKLASCAVLVMTMASCGTRLQPREQAMVQQAMEQIEGMAPASAEDRAAIKAETPLGQANFWRQEFEKNPSDLEAAIEYADALRQIGSASQATEVAARALPQHPDSFELALVLGQAMLADGRASTAIDAFVHAISLDSQNAKAYALKAIAHDYLGDFRAAHEVYEMAIQLSPEDPAIYSNYGLSLASSGEPEAAEEMLLMALSLNPNHPQIRQNMSLVLSLQGRFDEAQSYAAQDLPNHQADKNINQVKAMISPPPSRKWSALRGTLDQN